MPQGNYTNLANPGIVGRFYEALETEWESSWANALGWLNPDSTQVSETYAWLGNVPKFREWIGGRAAVKPRAESYSIRNKLWEQTLEFSIDDLERDKTGQVQARISELGRSGAAFWEDQITSLINGGAATNCYDGQYFFDTDHPVAQGTSSSTTATNAVTASQIADLNISTATAPTPDEAAKCLFGMLGYFQTYVDDQNHQMNNTARNFTVMVSTPNLWAPICTAITAMNLTSGASNPLQGARAMGYQLTPILNTALTSATTYIYMFRTDRTLKPFILQEEGGVKVESQAAGSNEAFMNRRYLFGTSRKGNGGYGLWQYAMRATLS